MDIKELIKSIDTEGVLDAETLDTLTANAEETIAKKVADAKEEGKKEAFEEATQKITEAEKTGYERGIKNALNESETLIKEAEKAGYEAGVTKAITETEALVEEYDNQVKASLKGLAEAYDKYVDIITGETVKETEETVKESIVESLDNYLNAYVKEVIPESVVIDYDRMQRLEKTFSMFKDSLLVEDSQIQAKMKQLDESTNVELAKAKSALQKEVQKRIIVENQMNEQEARIILTEKTADVPEFERVLLMKKFKGCSADVINESFDREYEKIRGNLINESKKQEQKVVEVVSVKESTEASKTDEQKLEKVVESVDIMDHYARLVKKTR